MIKSKRGQINPAIQQTPKKSKWWLWLAIIFILIVVGIVIYFWLSGGDPSPVIDTGTEATGPIVDTGTEAGSQILQPPALPS